MTIMMPAISLGLLLLCLSPLCHGQQDIFEARLLFRMNKLDDADVKKLAELSNVTHVNEILDNILIPRVVGTKNHDKVGKYIVKELKKSGFQVDVDDFNDDTPNFGKLRFKNIIGRHNPNADRFLTFACHYDSKYFREGTFVGATDSAVPCAMLLNLAQQLKPYLSKESAVSLKLIFFDGEEAFEQWGPNDSIYGSKHLARKWSKANKVTEYGENIRTIDTIDVLVLLDLLGCPDPKFYNYFKNTEGLYVGLAEAEERLAKLDLFQRYSKNPQQTYFNRLSTQSFIEDDHVPFLKKGIPIVHMIPHPFPDVWHTPRDDRKAIDMATVENLNKILRVFTAEYLHLSVL